MKLFQQLLVAPAALGLLAPVAANASDLNINGVSDYAASGEQVTSITQFSDVYPTDWAYQALSNLIERYGCVAGYPNGTYRGNRAMTRFEAAALLNACLDRITEVTDELKRLMKEFEPELAILKGRVDGLEARVGELEATQFSTTTKLRGTTTFVIGANRFSGNARNVQVLGDDALLGGYPVEWMPKTWRHNSFPLLNEDDETESTRRRNSADLVNASLGAGVFNYDLQVDVNTSFTGKDLLRVRLRSADFQSSAFGFSAESGIGSPFAWALDSPSYRTPSSLEVAFEEGKLANAVKIDRLFYQFPVGDGFTFTVGGRVEQDDMLALWPSAYPSEAILDFFTYAGAPGAYNSNLGVGGGLWWKSGGFSISANYVSANGGNANSSPTLIPDPANSSERTVGDCTTAGGIATACSASTGTVQIGYSTVDDSGEAWGLAAAYNFSSQHLGNLYEGTATPLATTVGLLGNTQSVGLSGYWEPEESGWVPSVSVGWGVNTTSGGANATLMGYEFESATTQSWSIGLEWWDVFLQGNNAGMAVGQRGFVTALDLSGQRSSDLDVVRGFNDASASERRLVRDGQYAWEWWYQFQVTDSIAITPALFYLSRPLGTLSQGVSLNQFGGLLKTSFRF